jgi:hypothetical protein
MNRVRHALEYFPSLVMGTFRGLSPRNAPVFDLFWVLLVCPVIPRTGRTPVRFGGGNPPESCPSPKMGKSGAWPVHLELIIQLVSQHLSDRGDICQTWGTSVRPWGHLSDLGDICQTWGTSVRSWGHLSDLGDICQTWGTSVRPWGHLSHVQHQPACSTPACMPHISPS